MASKEAQELPSLSIPKSSSVVRISIIDTTSRVHNVEPTAFFVPKLAGQGKYVAPAYSFLIENESKNQKVLFDLGIPVNYKTLCAPVAKRLESLDWIMTADKDVADILPENNVSAKSINSIIWSHSHFDHIGDPSKFPASTSLVVGPGFKKKFLPGAPEDPEGIHSSAWEGRELVEVAFDQNLKIGRFDAIDYFGDGSFYLLDSPGHLIGHICALARTTEDTFMLLGGDACHHGTEIRPSKYRPIPSVIYPSPYAAIDSDAFLSARSGCPGSVFQNEIHPSKSSREPFCRPSEDISHDLDEAVRSIEKLQELDARENIFTVFAHDQSLFDIVDFFPNPANDWKAKGWKEKGFWRFLGEFKTSKSPS